MNWRFADLKKQDKCETAIYKTVKDVNLHINVVRPLIDVDNNTAIVFIHGGGWTTCNSEMYIPHCTYFAALGAVCFSIDYRLIDGKDNTLLDCIKDIRSAIRYIKVNAKEFSISPDKIVVIGDSAGGYLATSLTTIDPIDEENDDISIDVTPNTIINCNAVLKLTDNFIKTAHNPFDNDFVPDIAYIQKCIRLSPFFNVKKTSTKILNLHGKQDTCVAFQDAISYHYLQLAAGNDSELVIWDDMKHAFIIIGYTATDEQIVRAINEIDSYLVRKKLLKNDSIIKLNLH